LALRFASSIEDILPNLQFRGTVGLVAAWKLNIVMVVASKPRKNILKIISKIASGLSLLYNTVRIPVKLIQWPLPNCLHGTLKRWNKVINFDGTVGSVQAGELEHLY
jgi:hypothetical protein